jgi:two-component system OmpR family response regulator
MRVLLAEHTERLAASLAGTLRSAGYAVDVVRDSPSASRLVSGRRHAYDVVILDSSIPGPRPGFNGCAVCRAWRDRGVTVPVLMLTSRAGATDRVAALDSGADDCLPKAYDDGELLARVRTLLRRPAQPLPPLLAVSDVVLDPARRTVSRNGKPVTLTKKEFAVLEVLMRHRGQVLSRDSIQAHVWDEHSDPASNAVDVHVRNLRRKVGDEDGTLVRTVRGVGYAIAA